MRSIAVVAIAVGSVALAAGVAHASTPASAPPEPTASATEDEAVAAFVAEFGDVWRHGPNCIYYEGDENWLCQAGTEDEVFVSAYGYERDDVWVWVSVGRMSGLEADQPGGITWAIYDTPLAHQIDPCLELKDSGEWRLIDEGYTLVVTGLANYDESTTFDNDSDHLACLLAAVGAPQWVRAQIELTADEETAWSTVDVPGDDADGTITISWNARSLIIRTGP